MRYADRDRSLEGTNRTGITRHRWTDVNPPAAAVVEHVACRTGVETTALAPLYDTIDPDALDALFCQQVGRTRRSCVRVVFFYAGYEVTVESDGWITVSDEIEPR